MTALNKEGKDQVIFVTKEKHEIPSTVKLIKEDANEDHEEKEEVKGSDCLEQFMSMQECLRQHPELYPDEKDPDPHTANPEPNSQQKDSASISDFTPTKESDTIPTETDVMPSQLPIAS
ncbi:coiled-coil-helix-coiled-coil-helix domain containing 4b [Myxocyprinus asiaticus]|uniref:coiled-coil-helix-coiled-coil-helix domain containing 4b n=1 Tax=Myxocyprinus asiaticus TaxID=70543 RepID=UPI0022223890|nr:coiled-coil-helix-coiled-coil-helix domain containing 4b [Myxocyprinus asiaticus]